MLFKKLAIAVIIAALSFSWVNLNAAAPKNDIEARGNFIHSFGKLLADCNNEDAVNLIKKDTAFAEKSFYELLFDKVDVFENNNQPIIKNEDQALTFLAVTLKMLGREEPSRLWDKALYLRKGNNPFDEKSAGIEKIYALYIKSSFLASGSDKDAEEGFKIGQEGEKLCRQFDVYMGIINNLGNESIYRIIFLKEYKKADEDLAWCLDVSEKLDHPYARASYLMLMGFSQNRQNNPKEAIRYCLLSYQILRGYSWQDSFVFNQVLSMLALNYYNTGEMEEAVSYYKELAALAESKEDKVLLCDYYDMIGNCYFRLGAGSLTADRSSPGVQYISQAEESFRKALSVAKAIKDEVRTARELNNIAYSLYYQGKNDDAVKKAKEGVQILERVGDKEKLANALFVYARILYAGRQTSQAIDNFLRSAKLFKEINSSDDLKACFQWIAEIYSEENMEKAVAYFNKTYELAESTGDSGLMINSSYRIAEIYERTEKYSEAVNYYNKALALSRKYKNQDKVFDCIYRIAGIYTKLKEKEALMIHYQNSIAVFRELNDEFGMAYAYSKLARLFMQDKNSKKALEYYRKALNIYQKNLQKLESARIYKNISEIYLANGHTAAAEKNIMKSIKLLKALQNESELLPSLMVLGSVHIKEKRWEMSLKTYQDALNIASVNFAQDKKEKFPSPDLIHIVMPSDASKIIASKGFCFRQMACDSRSPAIRSAYYNKAFESYKRAIEIQENLKIALPPEIGGYLPIRHYEDYESIVELLIETGRIREAFSYAERLKLRIIYESAKLEEMAVNDLDLESLLAKSVELRRERDNLYSSLRRQWQILPQERDRMEIDKAIGALKRNKAQYLRIVNEISKKFPKHLAFVTVKEIKVENIKKLIPEGDLVLEYLPTDENLIIFLITRGSFDVKQVPVKKERLNVLVSEYYQLKNNILEQYAEGKDVQGFSPETEKIVLELYGHLLRPVENEVKKNKNITIVPGGILYYLPFQALARKSGEELVFLVQDRAVNYLPSCDYLEIISKSKKAESPAFASWKFSPADDKDGINLEFFEYASGIDGTSSAILSLWPVSDKAKEMFLEEFNKNLKSCDKAEALRLAQLFLIKSREYSNPAFWLPFILIGGFK